MENDELDYLQKMAEDEDDARRADEDAAAIAEIEAKIAEEEAIYGSALDLEHCAHVRDAMEKELAVVWQRVNHEAAKLQKNYDYCLADLEAAERGKP